MTIGRNYLSCLLVALISSQLLWVSCDCFVPRLNGLQLPGPVQQAAMKLSIGQGEKISPAQTSAEVTLYLHHTAIKTRDIEAAINFYSLFGFEPTIKFRTGPARAAWLEQTGANSNRIELIEVPSYMLNEPEGMKSRALDLMKRQELLGQNHFALDVSESMRIANLTSLSDWIEALNEKSLERFRKSLRIAIEPQQVTIGNSLYELAFLFDADGALVELLHKQKVLPQMSSPGWEPEDSQQFVKNS